MSLTVVQVDAFTGTPFSGNPAAVCILPRPANEAWMRNLAREMNLSETAFLHPEADGFRLRWLTPKIEVDLCGHATLASAHVLWEQGHLPPDSPAVFHTRSGQLTAQRVGSEIKLDFPAKPVQTAISPEPFVRAFGIPPRSSWRGEYDVLLEFDDEATIRAMQPDFSILKQIDARGIIVTAPASTPGFDFVSRFFAPAAGIDEDPVTGSAHCCLGPFWGNRFGKTQMVGYQASERGGVVRVNLVNERVHLIGSAVTVMIATLVGEAGSAF